MTPLRVAFVSIAFLGLSANADEPKWRKHDINPASPFEAAGVLDVDGDGKLDVVSGEAWYKGPDFKNSYGVRDFAKVGSYYNCFSAIPMDVNADGKMDFITCSYFAKDVGWVENPGEAKKTWEYHTIDTPGNIEAAVAVDLTGDGKPEILPNSVNVVVYYELEKAGAEPKWKKVNLGNAAASHGVGTGDVNGDGKVDILTPKGWFEASDNHDAKGWTWHGGWDLGATGIQILAKDVDGDGLSDVVYGMGHGRGLFWIKQAKGTGDERNWSAPMSIDPTLTSVHTLMWVDVDGDGKKDEMLTGKRVYAHEIEVGDIEASQIAYYTFDKKTGAWVKHLIYQGKPAENAPAEREKRDAQKDFPKETAGTGLEMVAVDFDGDGDIDLICPGKSGLYWFENLGTKP